MKLSMKNLYMPINYLTRAIRWIIAYDCLDLIPYISEKGN